MASTQVLEEVTLNWTDLTGAKTGATALGSNKFYRGQIFGDFTVVFTYGRVGQAGQVQKVKGKDPADAQKQLKKKIDSRLKEDFPVPFRVMVAMFRADTYRHGITDYFKMPKGTPIDLQALDDAD